MKLVLKKKKRKWFKREKKIKQICKTNIWWIFLICPPVLLATGYVSLWCLQERPPCNWHKSVALKKRFFLFLPLGVMENNYKIRVKEGLYSFGVGLPAFYFVLIGLYCLNQKLLSTYAEGNLGCRIFIWGLLCGGNVSWASTLNSTRLVNKKPTLHWQFPVWDGTHSEWSEAGSHQQLTLYLGEKTVM